MLPKSYQICLDGERIHMLKQVTFGLLFAALLLAACSSPQSNSSVSETTGPIVEVYRSPT
jgi:uncharacterized lipoprotein YajG